MASVQGGGHGGVVDGFTLINPRVLDALLPVLDAYSLSMLSSTCHDIHQREDLDLLWETLLKRDLLQVKPRQDARGIYMQAIRAHSCSPCHNRYVVNMPWAHCSFYESHSLSVCNLADMHAHHDLYVLRML
jgi:hypothetical protein